MKKILLSLSMIAVVGAVVAGATGAFFSDTETSTGNTFTAGAIDLRVDNTCHYWNYVGGTVDEGMGAGWHDVGCPSGTPDNDPTTDTWVSSWTEKDLKDGVHKFFNFGDLKPGDWGEDTISLHVYDNDAWGRMKIRYHNDKDNTCTEPESKVEMGGNTDNGPIPGCTPKGELGNQMTFETWLDQGGVPGFQCGAVNTPGTPRCPQDPWEGDNIWQKWGGNVPINWINTWTNNGQNEDMPAPMPEPMIPTEIVAMELQGDTEVKMSGTPNTIGDPDFDNASFFDVFFEVDGAMKGLTMGNGSICPATNDGHNGYERCHGIAFDGRLVGSTTYYIGWSWHLPNTVGNNAQTDSVMGDMMFEVEQHRNNPRLPDNT